MQEEHEMQKLLNVYNKMSDEHIENLKHSYSETKHLELVLKNELKPIFIKSAFIDFRLETVICFLNYLMQNDVNGTRTQQNFKTVADSFVRMKVSSERTLEEIYKTSCILQHQEFHSR